MAAQDTVKLQKALAACGLGSRRQAEKWIDAGRVTVNGSRAKLGARVKPEDVILFDGRRVPMARDASSGLRVLAYNKPAGEVCSRRDPEGRVSVFDSLPSLKQGRWIGIGRLDISTTGLLLFTNQGDLAHRLMHPSSALEREYFVRVFGSVSPEALSRLVAGVALDDGLARFERVVPVGGPGENRWYKVTLRGGRNREVRRLWESQGVRVSRLKRVRFGPIVLPRGLKVGRWEELDARGIAALQHAPGPARRARRGTS